MAIVETKIKYEEEYVANSRGDKLFTCRWVPVNREPKALIFLCHGYAMETSISMNGTGTLLAKAGYAVHGVDYQGHGKSYGLLGYVDSFDTIIDDCSDYFSKICELKENRGMMRFLMGESMGGAVALRLHRKRPDYWDGVVLIAPMCKIADGMRPSPMVVSVLTKLCNYVPTWKLIPTQDIIDVAFRRPEIREEVRNNPYCYKGRLRLKTGNELLNVSLDIEQNLHEVSVPFIVLHGEADKVTDPSVSKLLYETAASTDKTFKLHEDMWHSLSYGELPQNIATVFSDIVDWLDRRSELGNSRLEMQQKRSNDSNPISC